MPELNRDNLAKLAEYLSSLPKDYGAFEMQTYFDRRADPEMERNYALHNGGVDACGTVACAVGHGPSAGILFTEDQLMEEWVRGKLVEVPDWSKYCDDNFVDTCTPEWQWMFGSGWSRVDNTPHGAARRIRWILAGNTPPKITNFWYRGPDSDEPEFIDFYSAYVTEEHVVLYADA